jgi:broad specificity phosphatase PhoE
MTTIILVRHAEHDGVGEVLAGRDSRVALNALGRRTATHLAGVLARRGVDQVKSSPQMRALQTAKPLVGLIGVPIEIGGEFDEIDYGDWTGRRFDDLHQDAAWQMWNSARARSRPPGGESMGELQGRVLHGLLSIATRSGGQTIAVFSHAEPIRAALLHYRGMGLGEFTRVPIDVGSLTTLRFDHGVGTIIVHNERLDAGVVPA